MRKRVKLSQGLKSLAAAAGGSGGASGSSKPEGGQDAAPANGEGSKLQAVQIADEWEVARVLQAHNDHDCLKVRHNQLRHAMVVSVKNPDHSRQCWFNHFYSRLVFGSDLYAHHSRMPLLIAQVLH
jgi:hypothetical protein